MHSSTQLPPESQWEKKYILRCRGSCEFDFTGTEKRKKEKKTLLVDSSRLEIWDLRSCFDSDTFSAGRLSDVALAKYCPLYLQHISPEPMSLQI